MMAKSRIMSACVGLLFLATFGLQEVAADCMGPSLSSTSLFLQKLTDPYGTGSFLNETAPTQPSQPHECRECAVTGNESKSIEDGDAGPLVIKSYMPSRLPIEYLFAGGAAGESKVYLTGLKDETTGEPLPTAAGTKVVVRWFLNESTTPFLEGQFKVQAPKAPSPTPPNLGAPVETFTVPMHVVGGVNALPMASLVHIEVSISNQTCDCYDPGAVPISGAGQKWNFRMPFGPKPTPKVYMTAESYNLTAPRGEAATGTLNLTSYENLCQITVVLSDSGDVAVEFLSNASVFLQEPAYGYGFMKFPRFNVTVPEDAAVGDTFNFVIIGTVNGGTSNGSPGIIGRMHVATLNFTLTAVEPHNEPGDDKGAKKSPGFELLPLLAIGALVVALRRRTLRP